MWSRRAFKAVAALVVLALVLRWLSPVIVSRQKIGCQNVESAALHLGSAAKHNTERLRQLQSTCRLAQDGFVDRITAHSGTRTAFCVVPKASCTFWMSLFRSLQLEPEADKPAHPLHIPRALVHLDSKRMHFKGMKSGEPLPEELKDYFRFMFVRDPYSRVWSSYIDKFFLLDFWDLEGKKVEAFLNSVQAMQLLRRKRHITYCHSDITFAEFIAYVVNAGLSAPHSLNEHWRPLEYVCNPCQFCPSLLGKLETFQLDSLPVLKTLNLTWVLQSYDHKLHQMELLLDENFRQLEDSNLARNLKFYSSCTNTVDVSRRLWEAFQMLGYLPDSFPFPEQQLGENPTAIQFEKVLFRAYSDIPDMAMKALARQRQRAMEAAYRSVPIQVLEKLSTLYLYEFLAFGYEMRPRWLFGDRYD